MRHESIETTLRYYVALDADDLADDLWREFSLGGFVRADNTATGAGAR
jgi:hypothetical protein